MSTRNDYPAPTMKRQALQDTLRLRLPDGWKKRLNRVARKRGCDASDVARESMIVFLAAEEERLGITGNGK